jgi:hypothetical protein
VTRATLDGVRHDERLRAPWTWWLLVAGFSLSVWWSFFLATPVWFSTVAGLLTLAGVSALLWHYGNARVALVDGRDGPELVAGRAHVPVSLCGEPEPLDAEQLRHRLGPGADARSYVLVRPYSRGGVLVPLRDPRDPTPSWVVASRRPVELAAALRAARAPLAD